MSRPYMYWLVRSAAAKAVAEQLDKDAAIEREKILNFALAHGGDGVIKHQNNRVISIQFEDPDKVPPHWRLESFGYYRPYGNSDAARADRLEMKSFYVHDGEDVGLRFLGERCVVEDHKAYTPCLEEIGNQLVIVGIESDQWKPIKGLKKIKTSTYWVMREKHAAKIEKQTKKKGKT